MKFDENFIKSHIDCDYLTEDRKARRKKTNEFFTPYSIIKRMGDKIPEEYWSDPDKTFLEPCAGNGNFVLYIIYNRLCHGIDIEQILKTLYIVELMPDNVVEMKERILNMLNKLSIDIDVNKFNKITNKHFICNNFFRWNCIEWREKTEDEIKFEIKKNKISKTNQEKLYNKFDINDFLEMDNNEILRENKGKKFDIILSNPPYDRNLHLKFLEKYIQLANKVISIQPITWITDMSGEFKQTSNYNKYEESISKHIKDLEILRGGDMTKSFGSEKNIAIANDLGIYLCDKNGGYNYKKENKFPYFLYKKRDLPFTKTTYENAKDKIFVPIRKMAGCVSRSLPAVSITQKYGVFVNDKDKNGKSLEEEKKANKHFTVGSIDNDYVIVFNTIEEAESFYTLCNCDFWKVLCYKSTTSNSIPINILPWPDNFKQNWTEDKIIEYLNLSEEDIKEYNKIKNELSERLHKINKTIADPI